MIIIIIIFFFFKIHATWKDFVDKFSKLLNVNAADDPVSFEALQKLIGESDTQTELKLNAF